MHRRTHYSLSLIKPVSYQTVLHRGAEVMHGKATTKTDDACFSWHFTTPTSSRDVRVGVRVGVVECQLSYAVHRGVRSSLEYKYIDRRPGDKLRRSHTHRSVDTAHRTGRPDNLRDIAVHRKSIRISTDIRIFLQCIYTWSPIY